MGLLISLCVVPRCHPPCFTLQDQLCRRKEEGNKGRRGSAGRGMGRSGCAHSALSFSAQHLGYAGDAEMAEIFSIIVMRARGVQLKL